MAALRNAQTTGIVIAAIATWMAGACGQKPTAQEVDAARLGVEVRFTSMWWSQAQMEGLNPNDPPPKNTEVELTRWEYSDPIGVPHPDVVNVVVTLKNRGQRPMSDLTITTEGEWKAGSLEDEASAKWEEEFVLGKADERVQLAAGAQYITRTPVNLKQMMDTLEGQDRWPYALRVTVTVRQQGAKQTLARTQVELPIRPGN